MGTPLGNFVRAKRDSIRPHGLPDHRPRRAPGLRRSELAALAGISVEYLTRIEQGHDRNPSGSVVNALADALGLDPSERFHLGYLAKISGGMCSGHARPTPAPREVRPAVRQVLDLLDPGVAMVANRLGDVLAYTDGFAAVMRDTGLLDDAEPNLTRYAFTHPMAREMLADWEQMADELVFNMWLGPSREHVEWFTAALAPIAGAEFTQRFEHHLPPPRIPLRLRHPHAGQLRFNRESLELPSVDAQQVVVLLPADDATAAAVTRLRQRPATAVRAG